MEHNGIYLYFKEGEESERSEGEDEVEMQVLFFFQSIKT